MRRRSRRGRRRRRLRAGSASLAILGGCLAAASVAGLVLLTRVPSPPSPALVSNPFASPPAAAAADADGPAPSVAFSVAGIFRGSSHLEAEARPARPGVRVVFQRRDGGVWTTIASAPQDAGGRARATWTPPAPGVAALRAAVATDADGPARYSRPVNAVALAPGARIVTWREWVEPGLGGRDEFIAALQTIFADGRGWAARGGVAFRYEPRGRVDLLARLATPATTDRLCHPADTRLKWSCHAAGSIVINSDRWFEGSPTWPGSVQEYRALVVNHETGHALGLGHAGCGGRGRPAPVMMQQSKGLGGCRANPWPLSSELARI